MNRHVLARDAKRDLNAEVLASIRDMNDGRIGRGWKADAEGKVHDVSASRARMAAAMSQTEFAGFLGVSVRTLRQWEQGRRGPRGAHADRAGGRASGDAAQVCATARLRGKADEAGLTQAIRRA